MLGDAMAAHCFFFFFESSYQTSAPPFPPLPSPASFPHLHTPCYSLQPYIDHYKFNFRGPCWKFVRIIMSSRERRRRSSFSSGATVTRRPSFSGTTSTDRGRPADRSSSTVRSSSVVRSSSAVRTIRRQSSLSVFGLFRVTLDIDDTTKTTATTTTTTVYYNQGGPQQSNRQTITHRDNSDRNPQRERRGSRSNGSSARTGTASSHASARSNGPDRGRQQRNDQSLPTRSNNPDGDRRQMHRTSSRSGAAELPATVPATAPANNDRTSVTGQYRRSSTPIPRHR